MDLRCIIQVVLLLLHEFFHEHSAFTLEQGGLEIPAKIIFYNSNKRIIEEMKKKLAPLIEEYNKKHQLRYVHVIRYFKKNSFIKFYFFSSRIRCALKLGALKIKLLTKCALNN